MTDYESAKRFKALLEAQVTRTSAILRTFPKGPMGLTPDAIKVTPEFKRAKAEFDESFAMLHRFNRTFVKTFAKQIKAERRARKAVKE